MPTTVDAVTSRQPSVPEAPPTPSMYTKPDFAGDKPAIALVRAPLLSREGALNNEAVPHIGMAYVGGYLREFGYPVELVDGIADGLNEVHPWHGHRGFQLQGLPLDALID